MKGAEKRIHKAVERSLPEGDALIGCVIVAEVSSTDGGRYLAHRATHIGSDGMMSWTALGMLQAATRVAADQVAATTGDAP